MRSWRGDRGAWYRGAQRQRAGHIAAGGVEKDVALVAAVDADDEAIDAAYRGKYARYPSYVGPMVSDQARATTLRLVPAEHHLGGALGLGILVTVFDAAGSASDGAQTLLAERVSAALTAACLFLALASRADAPLSSAR